ncbi:PAS domain S-box protein [candidate division KSB1 bacterium]|nr:PAS domain S-box protein [candidate division KSB1 bacterium]
MELIEEKLNTLNEPQLDRMYEELYSKADILYFLLDESGQIISCNVTGQEKLGYEKKQILGKKFHEYILTGLEQNLIDQLNICLNRGYIRDFSSSLRDHQGRAVDVLINGLSESDESGTPHSIRLFIKDVTELNRQQKQRELSIQVLQYLNESESIKDAILFLMKRIWENKLSTDLGVFLTEEGGKDLALGSWENPAITAEEAFENIENWTVKQWQNVIEAAKKTFPDRLTKKGSFWTDSLSDLVLTIDDFPEKESLLSLSDYESLVVIPVNCHLSSGYIVLTHKAYARWQEDDILFYETLTEAIATQSIPAPTLADTPAPASIPVSAPIQEIPLIGQCIVQDEKIISVNMWLCGFLDCNPDELIGTPIIEIIDTAYHELFEKISSGSKSADNDTGLYEAALLDKKGQSHFVTCALVPGEDPSAKVWYFTGKQNEEATREDLMQARKMEALGMLANGIVHDFNNLLSNMIGYTSLLLEEVPKTSRHYEDIKQIATTTETATKLTSRLLAFTEGKSYIASDLNANQLITEVAGVLSRTLNKNITIQADLGEGIWPLHGDAGQIQQAILQVALNAREALSTGGKILFQSRNMTLSESAAKLQKGTNPGDYIQIIISDTGQGMTGEVREKMFNPEFSTASGKPGKGLGLSMVKEIINQNGGFISVFSDITKGTIFKINLPVSQVKQAGEKKKAITKPAQGKETILLVETEKGLRDTARKMLTRYGYKVISAENANEALAIYKRNMKRIDLIILQMLSPGVEIQKVMAWLKRLNPSVQVIATASLGESDFLDKNLRRHFSGFIQKPFQIRPLLREVQAVLNA